jgi:hypothetical protein
MFKKLIAALILGIFLVSCSGVPVAPTVAKPMYIQQLEDAVNSNPDKSGSIDIIKWENDGHTLWIWIDNKSFPASCDYVVVLGIVNQATMSYNVVRIINSKDIPNACEFATIKYKEYREFMEAAGATLPSNSVGL